MEHVIQFKNAIQNKESMEELAPEAMAFAAHVSN